MVLVGLRFIGPLTTLESLSSWSLLRRRGHSGLHQCTALVRASHLVTGLSKPVTIIGDFKITPEEFMTTTVGTVMQVHVHLAKDLDQVTVQQIQRFHPQPRLEKIYTEWTQLDTIELPVKWMDNAVTQLAGCLYHKIERYVLQAHDKPVYGRGTQLGYIQKPLTDPSKPWLRRKGALAFRSQLEVRLQQRLHRARKEDGQMQHLEKLGWRIASHWSQDANVTLEGFMLLFNMLYGGGRVTVLLGFAKQQWDLRQEEVFTTETTIQRLNE